MKETLRLVSLAAAVFLACLTWSLPAAQAGKFSYRGAPENLDGRTIIVSDTMVAMAEKVKVMSKFVRDSTVYFDPPSIFFIIDNSASMQTNPGNDRYGSRFMEVRRYIDTLQNCFPSSEVGVAVFGTHLYFDPNDRPYFTGCAAQTNGAYVPLLRLDSMYAGYGGLTGYQIIKGILDTAVYDTGASAYVSLKYQPTDTALRGRNANINAGFDAARCAFSATARGHHEQYIVFLSDGQANEPSGDPNAFTAGTNLPATFSICFPSGAAVPANIATLTANVRVNNYSTKNPNSIALPFSGSVFTTLFGFMMSNIMNLIFTTSQTAPSIITVNGLTITATNYNVLDSTFSFPFVFPLTGTTTPFNIQLTYHRTVRDVPLPDTTFNINYLVSRRTGAGVWNPQRDSFDIKLWDRDLSFRYADTLIPSIDATMDSVQVYFSFDSGSADYSYNNIRAEFSNKTGAQDLEIFPLTRVAGNVFSVKFKRAVAAGANPGDGVVQYRDDSDSIIAVFRNREVMTPALPLDTLRVAIGFSDISEISHGDKNKQQHYNGTWLVFPDNSGVRVHIPESGPHAIKIYSLSGTIVHSQTTGGKDLSIRLPKGIFIVSVNGSNSAPRMIRKVVTDR